MRSAIRVQPLAVLLLLGFSAPLQAAPVEVPIKRIERPPHVADFQDTTARAQGVALQMARVEGFTARLPQDGLKLSERTEVYLGYDDESLHAVFVCFDARPDQVGAHLSSRDLIPGSDDSVAFQIDTLRDLTHAYGFQVNALGVQQDGTYTEGKGWDLSFDTVWHSEGRRTSEGYVVVISVPFKSLRFPKGDSKSFGMMLFRGITRTNEEGFWPGYSAKIAGRMNQAAVVTGLNDVGSSGTRQFIPYTTARSYRTLDRGAAPRSYSSEAFDAAIGGDAKFVVRDSLSLDLTANPDFSQVESDEPQVTVNRRFETFFPEKRPFFLENASFFDTPIPLFFSRRIQDPDIGGRLSGRQGLFSVGALVARDRATGKDIAAVTRVSRDLGTTAAVGFFGSSRALGDDGRNSVSGLDGRFRWGAWQTALQVAGSWTDGSGRPMQRGYASRATIQRTGRAFLYNAEVSDRSADFKSALGYIDRVDLRRLDQIASHRFFRSGTRFIDWGPDVSANLVQDRHGRPLERLGKIGLTADWARQTRLSIYRQLGTVRLRRSEFEVSDAEREVSSAFSQELWGVGFAASPMSSVTVSFDGSLGNGINLVPAAGQSATASQELSWNGQLEFRPTARLGFAFSGLRTRLAEVQTDLPVFVNRILRAKAQFQFSRALSIRAIAQYDTLVAAPARTRLTSERRINADVLATYLLSPGTAIYMGFNNNVVDLDRQLNRQPSGLARPVGGFLSDGRQFFIKASYLLRR